MAAKVFNPPPGWPSPPPGWQPSSGWQPDPSWDPAPDGWELWVRANRHPFRWSFGVAAGLYALVLLGLVLAYGPDSEGAGRLLFNVLLLPGLVVGFLARGSDSRWRWWRYLLTVVGFGLLFLLLSGLGAATGVPGS